MASTVDLSLRDRSLLSFRYRTYNFYIENTTQRTYSLSGKWSLIYLAIQFRHKISVNQLVSSYFALGSQLIRQSTPFIAPQRRFSGLIDVDCLDGVIGGHCGRDDV